MQKDNIVYHGLAGHFFLQDISHVLKVRIVADLQDRIREEMKREKISQTEAEKVIKKDDDERRKWSLFLYGKDTWDPSLYDMILHIKTITTDEAVEIILCALQEPSFLALFYNLTVSQERPSHHFCNHSKSPSMP